MRKLRSVVREAHTLGINGFGDGAAGRAALLAREEDVAWIVEWLLQRAEPRKTVNHGLTSAVYARLISPYHPKGFVHNGEVIAAALVAGFPVMRCSGGSQNAWFGIVQRSIDRIPKLDGGGALRRIPPPAA